ncbi:MAG TPA: hypothetical protein VE057_21990 [Archangium sp.]|nr:hypothetical protein [Archangium sp.]
MWPAPGDEARQRDGSAPVLELPGRSPFPSPPWAALKGICGGEDLKLTLDSETQDEPVNDTGHGKGSPDARWVDDRTDAVYLRAERSGQGDGRT